MRAHRWIPLVGSLLLAAAAPALAQINPKNMDSSPNPRGNDISGRNAGPYGVLSGDYAVVHPEVYQLWKRLEGRYEGTVDGTHLTLTLKRTSPYVLFAETKTGTGAQQETSRGYLEVGDASPSYASTKLRYSLLYRPESLRKAYSCYLYGYPAPAGVSFESEDGDCSFTFGRPVPKLLLDVSHDSLAVSFGKDGESTVLTRIASGGK